jgi:propanol-preferring alcohol dehydrogenase
MLHAAAQLLTTGRHDLVAGTIDVADPGPGEVLLRVSACGVCRTDLHILDGDLTPARLPLAPGHEIVGRVQAVGPGVTSLKPGDRVGVPWLGGTCGTCAYCRTQRENLCDAPAFTGFTRHGGFAEYTLARAAYCFALPDCFDDVHAAPLLCAGLIGYRALRMADDAATLGIYGFGAAAHLIAQVAVWQGRRVFAFTRPGDTQSQHFARSLGCAWAADSTQVPPEPLDAALLFAPVGALVPAALAATRKGGTVVCAGIHMSPIPSFDYALLWGERVLRSVANLTRDDGVGFLNVAEQAGVRTHVQVFDLADANAAVDAVRQGRVDGAAVLRCA